MGCLIFAFLSKTEDDSFSTDNLTDATAMPVSPGSWYVTLFRRRRHWNFLILQPSVCFFWSRWKQPEGHTSKSSAVGKKSRTAVRPNCGKSKFTFTFQLSELNGLGNRKFKTRKAYIWSTLVVATRHRPSSIWQTAHSHAGEMMSRSAHPQGCGRYPAIDKGRDRTNYFYRLWFSFNTNNTVNVTTSSGNVSGTWKLTQDSGKPKWSCNSRPPPDLMNWMMTGKSPPIWLSYPAQNVSGGNGGISTLSFSNKMKRH